MSTGTRRQDHDRADAYALARSRINDMLGRYRRRLTGAAEAYIDEQFQQASAAGLPFDPDKVGVAALEHAFAMYMSQEQIEAEAKEVEADG